ncbi:MAG: hypothetical protein D6689_18210 [Deltaproteobacteria bacterium]|nr:MAG: hypothetical protein D6689_18210 [Deltaproteobacteria bacterium]
MSPRTAVAAVAVALAAGSGGCARRATPTLPAAALRPPCDAGTYFDGRRCAPRGDAADRIARGAALLADFQVDAALAELEAARDGGPLAYADHVRLYEQLGIAYAYLERDDDALAAFATLLRLDPGHLLSYTLSPRVTFLFERARRTAGEAPAIDVQWPRQLDVARPVPIDVEVVADPAGSLARAELYVRERGTGGFRVVDVPLESPGRYRRVILPPAGGDRPATLEVYATALDARGNEVLVWAGRDRPREIPLGYTPPTPWYRKWWVWAVAGTTVAAATGATVFAITRSPPATLDGDFSLR